MTGSPGPGSGGIQAMPLYVDIERIRRDLREDGLEREGTWAPESLYPFDQFHYHGIEAVRGAAARLGIGPGARVLDVGSGLGGPARCLAHEWGAHVTALELQASLHEMARELTTRCGLDGRVSHLHGDVMDVRLAEAAFDCAVSWMVLHHIDDRAGALRTMARALRTGGRLYVEDLFARSPFSEEERPAVARLLFGQSMTDAATYMDELREAGFEDVAFEDATDDWGAFCAGRSRAFRAGRARHVRVHGVETFERLDDFFSGVARLFAGGHLGGVRIVATRASTA